MVGSQLKLIDFGISNKLQDDCTSVLKDLRCGTFNYMAPEMLQAQDKEGEVYKVGEWRRVFYPASFQKVQCPLQPSPQRTLWYP